MPYPLEPEGVMAFGEGLELIMVIEEKRALIEVQIKEELYGRRIRPRIIGKMDENGKWLFPAKGALEPVQIALALARRLAARGESAEIAARIAELEAADRAAHAAQSIAERIPYFCAGCPHNTSTVVPEGSRAYAGIGCHYMAQWMDRSTEGFTQMGGEGANWIGEAPFSKRGHVFQNIGDGTFIHSGSLAIRAAVAAGTNVTFKLLYNDAVAMTGGQALDGGMSVAQMAQAVEAEGAKRVAVVSDQPEKFAASAFSAGTRIAHRDDLDSVQRDLAQTEGVTVLIYEQTCAAEKRRRRKRGAFPDPDMRVMINELVCEGCGDCGVQSNCVAIEPVETEFGRKRAIDQDACNKDFSCIKGFCPSFVTVHGGKRRQPKREAAPDGERFRQSARAGASGARPALFHGHHRHWRHRRRHHRRHPRHGRPSRRQGRRHHRYVGPCSEGRTRGRPCAHRRVRRARSKPSAPRRRAPIWWSAAISSSPAPARCSASSAQGARGSSPARIRP